MAASVRIAADCTFCTAYRQGEMYSTTRYRNQMAEKLIEKAPRLDDPDERLRWARARAGCENASEAARRYHWNENTYRSHENAQRGISKKAAVKYARAFKVPVEWLLYGQGSMVPPPDPELITLFSNLTPDQQEIIRQVMRQMNQTKVAA